MNSHLSRPAVTGQARRGHRKARRAAVSLRFTLLQMGFTWTLSVTEQAVVSYTAFPPLPAEKAGGLFLLHYPWSRLRRMLSGILPCEARTFLTLRY